LRRSIDEILTGGTIWIDAGCRPRTQSNQDFAKYAAAAAPLTAARRTAESRAVQYVNPSAATQRAAAIKDKENI
jgi:hypothetical protein